jgi:phosphoribosylformylglycinamidine synthase I
MTSYVGVITFPGSNGDHDAMHAFSHDLGVPTRLIDYRETDLSQCAALVLPGGFSYGDHLRCGAIARFAPVVESLKSFAQSGGPVIGFCNGFQILTEAHLLPGALLRNDSLQFRSQWVDIRIENNRTEWTRQLASGEVLHLPIAHGDGSYFAEARTLSNLEDRGQVIARYCDSNGQASEDANPNGSTNDIAGISNEAGNVVGLMPHPERATDTAIGGNDGLKLLRAVMSFLAVTV